MSSARARGGAGSASSASSSASAAASSPPQPAPLQANIFDMLPLIAMNGYADVAARCTHVCKETYNDPTLWEHVVNETSHFYSGRNHFLWSAHRGKDDRIRYLLTRGADPNTQSANHYSALMLAAKGGHLTVVSLLLEKGANVTHQGASRWSALEFALHGKHTTVSRMLLHHACTQLISRDLSTARAGASELYQLLYQAYDYASDRPALLGTVNSMVLEVRGVAKALIGLYKSRESYQATSDAAWLLAQLAGGRNKLRCGSASDAAVSLPPELVAANAFVARVDVMDRIVADIAAQLASDKMPQRLAAVEQLRQVALVNPAPVKPMRSNPTLFPTIVQYLKDYTHRELQLAVLGFISAVDSTKAHYLLPSEGSFCTQTLRLLTGSDQQLREQALLALANVTCEDRLPPNIIAFPNVLEIVVQYLTKDATPDALFTAALDASGSFSCSHGADLTRLQPLLPAWVHVLSSPRRKAWVCAALQALRMFLFVPHQPQCADRAALAIEAGVVPLMVRLLATVRVATTDAEHICSILSMISRSSVAGKQAVIDAGAVPVLVKIARAAVQALESRTGDVPYGLQHTFRYLMAGPSDVQSYLLAQGVLTVTTQLLNHEEPLVRSHAADTVYSALTSETVATAAAVLREPYALEQMLANLLDMDVLANPWYEALAAALRTAAALNQLRPVALRLLAAGCSKKELLQSARDGGLRDFYALQHVVKMYIGQHDEEDDDDEEEEEEEEDEEEEEEDEEDDEEEEEAEEEEEEEEEEDEEEAVPQRSAAQPARARG